MDLINHESRIEYTNSNTGTRETIKLVNDPNDIYIRMLELDEKFHSSIKGVNYAFHDHFESITDELYSMGRMKAGKSTFLHWWRENSSKVVIGLKLIKEPDQYELTYILEEHNQALFFSLRELREKLVNYTYITEQGYKNLERYNQSSPANDQSSLPFYRYLTDKGKPLIAELVGSYLRAKPKDIAILLRALWDAKCTNENLLKKTYEQLWNEVLKPSFKLEKSAEAFRPHRNDYEGTLTSDQKEEVKALREKLNIEN